MVVPKRNTKKSRLVGEFSNSIVELVLEENYAPSKMDIIENVVNQSLGHGASIAIRTLMEDELANELERYFRDSVKAAADELDMPYHLVSRKYYTRRSFPASKDIARTQIATFGNGRGNKAAGIRFVDTSQGDVNDIYLMLVAEKRMMNTKSIVDSTVDFVEKGVAKGALPVETMEALPISPKKLAK